MAEITASMVKELREKSGAGMMDCKKALNECGGNMDEAMEFLRKNGQAKAEKKASRIAAEGVCRVACDGDTKAAVVEVNSETDFVAKNEKFTTFVEQVAAQAVKSSAKDLDALMAEPFAADPSKTVSEALVEMVAVIGEKLSIRRFERVEAADGCVATYLHGGGRIGVIVKAKTATVNDAVKEALTNVAMQVAAMNPEYLKESDISDAEKAKMLEITVDSALNDPASLPKPLLSKLIDQAIADKKWSDADIAIYEEKKSNMNFLFNFLSKEAAAALAELAMSKKAEIVADKIFDGLVKGRISKQEKEIVLMNQVYVRAEDGKQTVAQYLAQVSKEVGTEVSVEGFVRYETGEGMEKKNEDFAAEVAAQMNA
ncbi:MAG: translation elongation factor Ts [Lachnospiraceae bacterium]|nr:translation elongation factor Ts [Lachnospiraceae bacterium]